MKQKLILLVASFLLIGCGAATWGNMSQTQISSWQSAGLTIENYGEWKEEKFTPDEAKKWIDNGVTAKEAVKWRENKFTADETSTWRNAEKTLNEAIQARAEGLAPITK